MPPPQPGLMASNRFVMGLVKDWALTKTTPPRSPGKAKGKDSGKKDLWGRHKFALKVM